MIFFTVAIEIKVTLWSYGDVMCLRLLSSSLSLFIHNDSLLNREYERERGGREGENKNGTYHWSTE
jgi:hypothetical protein